jgi:hypothetical protein
MMHDVDIFGVGETDDPHAGIDDVESGFTPSPVTFL